MPALTNDQLETIAQTLSDIAAQLSAVRSAALHSGTPIDDPDVAQLLALSLRLSDLASTFALRAAELTLADADQAVATITAATQSAVRALDRLRRIDKAISIASAVIVLTTAVFTADPGQIAQAAQSVFASAAPSADGLA